MRGELRAFEPGFGLIHQILVSGEDSWLHQRLVQEDGFTAGVSGSMNDLGNMYNYAGPMLWNVSLRHDADVGADDILASVDDAEFTYLRDKVGATDGNISTHLSRLCDAGYVEVHKELQNGRAASRYRLSSVGRAAFGKYLERIEDLLGRAIS